jgi:hypothetical protein
MFFKEVKLIMASTAPTVTKLVIYLWYYTDIIYNELHSNRPRNVESAERNSFRVLNKVWLWADFY